MVISIIAILMIPQNEYEKVIYTLSCAVGEIDEEKGSEKGS